MKQPLRTYIVVSLLNATYFGIPVILGGRTPNMPVYIAIFSIPLMVIGGGLEAQATLIGISGYLAL